MPQVYCQFRVSVKMRVCGEFRCPSESAYERTPRRNNPSQPLYRTVFLGRISKTGKIRRAFPNRRSSQRRPMLGCTRRPVERSSDVTGSRLKLDALQCVQSPAPRSGASVASHFPGVLCFNVRWPERPGAALHRSGRVDLAPAGLRVEEHAVPIRIVPQDPPSPHQLRIQQSHLAQRFAQFGSDRGQLFVRDPHRPWCARAAITALRTLESQALRVPGGRIVEG